MRYRPLAPHDLDTLVGNLRRLAGETILPWRFDPDTKQFYVEVEGERHAVSFGNGDAETQIVELLTANLDLFLDAVAEKFVLIDREWICRPRKSALPGSTPPATESSSPSGDMSPSAAPGSAATSADASTKRSTRSAKSSAPKKPRKSAKK